ncbi:MAG: FAD-dependent oxidoreductase [Phototrophicales bacterium]|nr:MAG: FAD-dependent oxidoreductase [Phototrophicales bacterium]
MTNQWQQLQERKWDIIIVGGGITGAGILREAARRNLAALLVEQRDFAWGTSSRSSKLVHGGLRYLATGQLGLTLMSVREREQLLEDGPGLIDPLGFLVATHKGDTPGRLTYGAGLAVYDLMALQWSHRYYSASDFQMLAPHINTENLQGGFRYGDAQTDDARLVLRVIQEAVADGGMAVNYTRAEGLVRDKMGVCGVILRDLQTNQTAEIHARVVINATGAWADHLRKEVGAEAKMRPLRGSHLIFPAWKLPVAQAITFLHPIDRRPVFIFPWEGVTLVGTTDIDHTAPLDDDPAISPEEVAYLMAAVVHQFPSRQVSLDDVIATYAGVRPVVGTGKDDPSKESRDYVIWQENGLLTVTGGKLTTFRTIALNALSAAADALPNMPELPDDTPVLDTVEDTLPAWLDVSKRRRLVGRYGAQAAALVEAAQEDELQTIPGTTTLWAELRWAARMENVVHLEDLMLRRTRLGLLLPGGGESILPRIREICQPELGWDDSHWQAEQAAYLDLWRACYSLPSRDLIPDWQAMLASAKQQRQTTLTPEPTSKPLIWVLFIASLILLWYFIFHRERK